MMLLTLRTEDLVVDGHRYWLATAQDGDGFLFHVEEPTTREQLVSDRCPGSREDAVEEAKARLRGVPRLAEVRP